MSDSSPDVQAPAWFIKATSAPSESHYVDVAGTPIHYLTWNAQDTHKPGLLFAHGFRAHARWWSFVAPFLMSRFRVVSMDFAGMGDSGSRDQYTTSAFTQDILGVIEDAKLGKPILVGHSFGGSRVMRTCADHPDSVERAVVIDSHVYLPNHRRSDTPIELPPKRVYPTFEAARARFRLVPPHNRAAPHVLDYVARNSLKQVEGGWTWKFDGNLMPRMGEPKGEDVLSKIRVPVSYVYGDDSAIVSRQHAHDIIKHLPTGRGPIAVPDCHHHVMLDQPLSLVAVLRALLY